MKKLLFIFLLLPAFAKAQLNRSATELAKENLKDYITEKLFRNTTYRPASFGELTPRKEADVEVAWSIEHKFSISESQRGFDKKNASDRVCRFVFYFDNKMRVLRAESRLE